MFLSIIFFLLFSHITLVVFNIVIESGILLKIYGMTGSEFERLLFSSIFFFFFAFLKSIHIILTFNIHLNSVDVMPVTLFFFLFLLIRAFSLSK